jgi:hypothetical protein
MINMKYISLLISSVILSLSSLTFAEGRTGAAIAVIEGDISLPLGAFPLGEYTRYYSDSAGDDWCVHGMYVWGGKKDIRIMPLDNFPKVLDGGCEIIRLKYDLRQKKMIFISCSGNA